MGFPRLFTTKFYDEGRGFDFLNLEEAYTLWSEEIALLPKPEVGQIVRLDTFEGKLIVTAVSEDGGTVDLASAIDSNHILKGIPCEQLLPAEGVDVG